MRQRYTAAALIAAALAAGSPVPANEAGLIALAGTWTAIEAKRDGGPAADVRGHRMTVTGGVFELVATDGVLLYSGTIGVDPAATPAAIDFIIAAGPSAGVVWAGVYRLDGDRLIIADNAPDPARPRPSSFEAPAGSGYVVVTFERGGS